MIFKILLGIGVFLLIVFGVAMGFMMSSHDQPALQTGRQGAPIDCGN